MRANFVKTRWLLWRCRACGTLNDFNGIEVAANEQRVGDQNGVLMLAEHKCNGCENAYTPPADWFITNGEKPIYIESAFEPLLLGPTPPCD